MDIRVSLSLYRLLVSDIKIVLSAATSQLKPLMTLNVALNHAIQFLHPDPGHDRQRDSARADISSDDKISVQS